MSWTIAFNVDPRPLNIMKAPEGFGSSATISTLCSYQVMQKIVKLMCGSLLMFFLWHTSCAFYAERKSSMRMKSLKVASASLKQVLEFAIMFFC